MVRNKSERKNDRHPESVWCLQRQLAEQYGLDSSLNQSVESRLESGALIAKGTFIKKHVHKVANKRISKSGKNEDGLLGEQSESTDDLAQEESIPREYNCHKFCLSANFESPHTQDAECLHMLPIIGVKVIPGLRVCQDRAAESACCVGWEDDFVLKGTSSEYLRSHHSPESLSHGAYLVENILKQTGPLEADVEPTPSKRDRKQRRQFFQGQHTLHAAMWECAQTCTALHGVTPSFLCWASAQVPYMPVASYLEAQLLNPMGAQIPIPRFAHDDLINVYSNNVSTKIEMEEKQCL